MLIVAAGFYFQLEIKQRYPAYDPTLLATGAIFVAGMIYAVVERNIIIALAVLVATITRQRPALLGAVPWPPRPSPLQ